MAWFERFHRQPVVERVPAPLDLEHTMKEGHRDPASAKDAIARLTQEQQHLTRQQRAIEQQMRAVMSPRACLAGDPPIHEALLTARSGLYLGSTGGLFGTLNEHFSGAGFGRRRPHRTARS